MKKTVLILACFLLILIGCLSYLFFDHSKVSQEDSRIIAQRLIAYINKAENRNESVIEIEKGSYASWGNGNPTLIDSEPGLKPRFKWNTWDIYTNKYEIKVNRQNGRIVYFSRNKDFFLTKENEISDDYKKYEKANESPVINNEELNNKISNILHLLINENQLQQYKLFDLYRSSNGSSTALIEYLPMILLDIQFLQGQITAAVRMVFGSGLRLINDNIVILASDGLPSSNY